MIIVHRAGFVAGASAARGIAVAIDVFRAFHRRVLRGRGRT